MIAALSLVGLATALASGCSSDEPQPACVPGIVRACPAAGCTQTCRADGSGFEPCSCTEAGTGGTSGSGGSGGMAGSSGAGGSSASGGAAGNGGSAGSSPTDGGADASDAGGGTPCSPVAGCWKKTQIATGTLNKAFADATGKLYVGTGSGYVTNVSGLWVAKPLNSEYWAIDGSGTPHTVVAGPPASSSSAGISYSTLVGSTWTTEVLPPVVESCSNGGAVTWDIFVAADGAPYVAWNRWVDCAPALPKPYASRSYRSGSNWISESSGGYLENNLVEVKHVAGAVDSAAKFHQAFMANSVRVPEYVNTAGTPAGLLYANGEASGQIVLAKPASQPVFALFSGWWYDGTNAVDHVILTRDVASPKQPLAATTLLSCAGEKASKHALVVSASGTIYAAWISPAGQARLATGVGGSWTHDVLGPASNVALVLASGQLHVFLEDAGAVWHVSGC